MQLSDKQKEFWNEPFHRWNIKHGATRTGKTYLDYFMIPRRIRERMGKEGLVVLLGNTKGTLQRNVIEPMQEIYGASIVSSIRSDNTATIFGEKVHCLGADSKKHVDRLRGTSIKYCYGDEVVSWEREVFEMLKSRLDKPYSCFDGTCNPSGPQHWFKLFINGDGDIFEQNYTIDDNPFLDPVVKMELKREHTGVFYERNILGRWVRAEGIIYPSFSSEEHIVCSIPEIRRLSYAVDVGHSNATVFLAVGEGVDGCSYVLDEFYHSGRNNQTLSPLAYAKKFIEFQKNIQSNFPIATYKVTYVDPSALGFMEQLRELGCFRIQKAANDVLPGIQTVSTELDKKTLKISIKCVHTINEFQSYGWDPKASDLGEDKPIKENDHCMDALRYYVYTKPRIASTIKKGVIGL